jgi:hypothetical protein
VEDVGQPHPRFGVLRPPRDDRAPLPLTLDEIAAPSRDPGEAPLGLRRAAKREHLVQPLCVVVPACPRQHLRQALDGFHILGVLGHPSLVDADRVSYAADPRQHLRASEHRVASAGLGARERVEHRERLPVTLLLDERLRPTQSVRGARLALLPLRRGGDRQGDEGGEEGRAESAVHGASLLSGVERADVDRRGATDHALDDPLRPVFPGEGRGGKVRDGSPTPIPRPLQSFYNLGV